MWEIHQLAQGWLDRKSGETDGLVKPQLKRLTFLGAGRGGESDKSVERAKEKKRRCQRQSRCSGIAVINLQYLRRHRNLGEAEQDCSDCVRQRWRRSRREEARADETRLSWSRCMRSKNIHTEIKDFNVEEEITTVRKSLLIKEPINRLGRSQTVVGCNLSSGRWKTLASFLSEAPAAVYLVVASLKLLQGTLIFRWLWCPLWTKAVWAANHPHENLF